LLCKNGFLLILLPFEPFEFENFEKNDVWRDQINHTIKSIVSDKNYELLYFTVERNYIIFLKKIN
jgi:hypothetical protein